ncbi:MAG: SlyX family protein [Polynucleobacter victoriensis]
MKYPKEHRYLFRNIMNQDERITNLEVKLSFSEDLLEELNQTVYKQQQQIDALIKEVKALKLQMASNLPSDGNSPRDEIPPHY